MPREPGLAAWGATARPAADSALPGLNGGQAGMPSARILASRPVGKASEATQTNRDTQPLYRERLKI